MKRTKNLILIGFLITSSAALAFLLISPIAKGKFGNREVRTSLLAWPGQDDRDRFYRAARELGSDVFYEDDMGPSSYDVSSLYTESSLPAFPQDAAFSKYEPYSPVDILPLSPDFIDPSSGLNFEDESTQALAMLPETKERISSGE
jgi:hypothetical protein